MLDHLHDRCGVVTRKAAVIVGQRALEELDPLSLLGRHLFEMKPAGRALKGGVGDVDAHDSLERPLPEHGLEQAAISTAEIQHPSGTGASERSQHRADSLVTEADPLLDLLLFAVV